MLMLASVRVDAQNDSTAHRATERIELQSKILNEERVVRVAVPSGYEQSQVKYPLLIVLDAEFEFDDIERVVDFLARNGEIPPCVVAGIENTNRERDMTPQGMRIPGIEAGGDRFLDFIDRELLPRLAADWRITNLRVMIGHSHGGLIAGYAIADRPTLLSAAVVLDTPAWLDDGWITRRVAERATAEGSVPIRVVVGEALHEWGDASWNALVPAAPAGSILHRFKVEDESHQSMYFIGAYRGLKLLFQSFSDAKPARSTLASIDSLSSTLSATYGGELPVPTRTYELAVQDCLLESRAADASAILMRWEAEYGRTSIPAQLFQDLRETEAAGPLDETVDSLTHGPRPSVEAIAPYLGRWEGTAQAEGGAPNRVAIEIRLDHDRVVGHIEHVRPDRSILQRDLVVIRIKDEALELGFMNGMHPRGVMLTSFRPSRAGDFGELTGQQKMAGVRFTHPEGAAMPPVTMNIKRVDTAGE